MDKANALKRDAQARRQTHRNSPSLVGNSVTRHPHTGPLHALPSWLKCLVVTAIAAGVIAGIYRWNHPPQSSQITGDGLGAGQSYAARMSGGGVATSSTGGQGEGVRANSQAQEASTLLSEGNQLAKEGKFEEAIAKYNEELAGNPKSEDVFFNLGVAHARLGRFEEAVKNYQKALEIMPDYAEVHNNLGNVLAQLGRFDEAVGHYETALKIIPDYASALNNLGTVYSRQKRLPEAVKRFQQAVKSLPTYMEAHFNLANGLVSLKRYEEAEDELKKVFELSPGFEPAIRLQARLKALGSGSVPDRASLSTETKP